MSTCAIVPVYNHGAEARQVISDLMDAGLDVILIDDASNRENARMLAKYAESNDRITLIRHRVNQGKGGAVMSGLARAHEKGHSHALQIDADGQHDTANIPALLSAARQNPQAIIAAYPIFDESIPKGRFYARYISHFWVWIETLSFDIRDSMCGFRLYPLAPVLRIMSQVKLGRRMDFDPEILVRLHWAGVPVVTVLTKVKYIEGGLSNFRPWHDNLLISWRHTRLIFGMLIRLPLILRRRFFPQAANGTDHA